MTRHDKETVCRPVDLSELVGCGVTLGYLDTSRYLSVPARRSIQYGAALRPSRIDRLGVLVLGAVLGAGLSIDAIAEPCADEETAATRPEVADTRIAPYFLVVRARKP